MAGPTGRPGEKEGGPEVEAPLVDRAGASWELFPAMIFLKEAILPGWQFLSGLRPTWSRISIPEGVLYLATVTNRAE